MQFTLIINLLGLPKGCYFVDVSAVIIDYKIVDLILDEGNMYQWSLAFR